MGPAGRSISAILGLSHDMSAHVEGRLNICLRETKKNIKKKEKTKKKKKKQKRNKKKERKNKIEVHREGKCMYVCVCVCVFATMTTVLNISRFGPSQVSYELKRWISASYLGSRSPPGLQKHLTLSWVGFSVPWVSQA